MLSLTHHINQLKANDKLGKCLKHVLSEVTDIIYQEML